MNFLFLIFFKDCDQENNQLSYYRCDAHPNRNYNWAFTEETGQIAFLLHSSSKGHLNFTSALKDQSSYILTPGQMISFKKQNVSASCNEDPCHLTIWHTSYDQENSTYLSDVSGLEVSGYEIDLPDQFSFFFDFGNNSKYHFKTNSHRKNLGVCFYRLNDNQVTTDFIPQLNESDKKIQDFESPGILYIYPSPYNLLNISLIIGSTVQQSEEFLGNQSFGTFPIIEKGIQKNFTSISKLKIEIPKQLKIFNSLLIFMLVITILIFLIGVLLIASQLCTGKVKEAISALIPGLPH